MKATLVRTLRDGFLKRNVDQISQAALRAASGGGISGTMPDLELQSFRKHEAVKNILIFSDQSIGGFSLAEMNATQFKSRDDLLSATKISANDPLPYYGRFRGEISTELPHGRPEVERSGYAAWRTPDPRWTILGKTVFNCDIYKYLALRVKADRSKYFVNMQADTQVPADLFQHRLFPATPGQWETIYIPFQEFVKTHYGQVMKVQGHIPKHCFTTVGLGLIDRIPGPFEICIDQIWATSRRAEDAEEPEPVV